MTIEKCVGVFFFRDVPERHTRQEFLQIVSSVKTFPQVSFVEDFWEKPLPNMEALSRTITKQNISRLVLAGDSPGFYKDIFSQAMLKAGRDVRNITLADFSEYGNQKEFSQKALTLIKGACEGEPLEIYFQQHENPCGKETLVIGGGIAGIQAALEIANSGFRVYLVEKSATIGGHMATFDKTFPTLDCAACILTPKMVEVGQHPNITLLSYSEVEEVSGQPGNYQVKVRQKARYVDMKTCIGCGICTEKCPGRAKSEFDAATMMRTAVYIPFPQAVPNKYLIDPTVCLHFLKNKCNNCEKFCPTKAIRFDDTDKMADLQVGNIVVATGFKVFDAKRAEQFGYGKYDNVLTALEFERLVNASGPTEGLIRGPIIDKKGNRVFTKAGTEPSSIAIIHCIGSRDHNYNKHCSRVCCMYSLKFAHLVKEKLHHGDVFEYYIDMRAFGKGYEEFYERIVSEGINVIRGRSAKVEEKDGKLLLRTEDILNGKLLEQKIDMIILSVGLEPTEDSAKISKMLGIERDEGGWFTERHHNGSPVQSHKGGIFVVGACQGPKDIPDSVAQGAAAAARVVQNIARGKIEQGYVGF